MNRFRKEQYITQRKGRSGLWTFQVFIRSDDTTVTKSFSEKKYASARLAFDSAVQFRNKMLYEIANNTVLRTQNMTVDDVFTEYLETSNDSYNTKCKHNKLYQRYITTKDVPIQKLTKANIISDLNAMTSVATDNTIMRVYAIYRKDIIGHALNCEYINRDLMAGISKPASRVTSAKKPTATDRHTILEVERLVLASGMNDYNKRLIVYLMEVLYYTGMRPAEAEVLTRSDIKDTHICVSKQLGSDKEDVNVVTRCKTDSSVRTIPIHPELKPILEELLDFARYDELFRKDDGHYMNSTYVGNCFRMILKDTDIKFNLYMLRHHMATALVTSGADSKTTMELLGHANYNMSLGYANSSEELKDKAIKLLS